MTRGRLIAIGTVCLLAACAATVVTRQTRARNRHFEALAQQYRQQAMAETSPSTTAGEAKAWLERNGFDVALYNGNVASERIEQTPDGQNRLNLVAGYRRVAPGSAMNPERWLCVEFLFRATGEPFVPGGFLGVEAYDDTPPTKALRSEFARRRSRTSPAPATPAAPSAGGAE